MQATNSATKASRRMPPNHNIKYQINKRKEVAAVPSFVCEVLFSACGLLLLLVLSVESSSIIFLLLLMHKKIEQVILCGVFSNTGLN